MLVHSWTEHRKIPARRSSRCLQLSCSAASGTLRLSEPRGLFLVNHRLRCSVYPLYMVRKYLNREHSHLHSLTHIAIIGTSELEATDDLSDEADTPTWVKTLCGCPLRPANDNQQDSRKQRELNELVSAFSCRSDSEADSSSTVRFYGSNTVRNAP